MLESRAYSNVCYEEMQRDPESNTWLVYTVTSDQLPSQYRSLKLYQADIGHDDKADPDVTSSKPRFSSRTVYAILASIFVVSLALAATISFIEIRKVLREEDLDLLINLNNTLYVPATANNSATGTQLLIRPLDDARRTPCVSTCRAYSKPRFRSRCVDGYCVCGGEGYQPSTCLPIVQQCAIQSTTNDSPTTTKAFLETSLVPVYSCHTAGTQSSTASVHVLSIYGNHFAAQTVVSVSGSRDAPVTLVLASHYPVNWKLKKHGGVDVRRIVMLSDLQSSRSTVDYSTATDANFIPPEVTSVNMHVGYGDDRHNSNTTEMLQTLTSMFGPVFSFSGAAFADYFAIKI